MPKLLIDTNQSTYWDFIFYLRQLGCYTVQSGRRLQTNNCLNEGAGKRLRNVDKVLPYSEDTTRRTATTNYFRANRFWIWKYAIFQSVSGDFSADRFSISHVSMGDSENKWHLVLKPVCQEHSNTGEVCVPMNGPRETGQLLQGDARPTKDPGADVPT